LIPSKTMYGQTWAKVGSGGIPYFLTPTYGFVYGSINSAPPTLSRTTDAGLTWTSLNFPSSFEFASQFCFLNRSHGYAATRNSHGPYFGGIYETIDSGNTWMKITQGIQDYYAVY